MRTERQLLPIPYHVSKPYASHAFHEKTLIVTGLMADVMFILAGLESARHDPASPRHSTSPRRSSGNSDVPAENAEKLSRLHDIFQYNRVSGSGSLKSDGRESASQ